MVPKSSAIARIDGVRGTQGGAFGQALLRALERLDAQQAHAEAASAAVAGGTSDDVAQAILAGEQARLALELAVAVRNRTVEAIQVLMRMPV